MTQTTLQRRPSSSLDLNELARQALQPWVSAYQPWADAYQPLADAYESWRSGTSDTSVKSRGKTHHKRDCGCGCADCEPDRCACRCCVNDSDLVLETHVGERRIITLVIENHWRRERPIELDLSSFTPLAGGLTLTATLLSPATFVIAPCAEETVKIEVEISAEAQGADTIRDPVKDILQCAVAYAALRIIGCDLRGVRLAVAVLPFECDAYKIDCACGCC